MSAFTFWAEPRTIPFSGDGYGMCVSLPHGLVIVSDTMTDRLHVYSLDTGAFMRRIGRRGKRNGQFQLYFGGLCLSPNGDSVLVADTLNDRVQQIKILDGSWERCLGEGGALPMPCAVDCNMHVLAVSHSTIHCITVLSWTDGYQLARFGGIGQLSHPRALRLLRDGGLVVTDTGNDRLCMFRLDGQLVRTVSGLHNPVDVLECADGAGFLVSSRIRTMFRVPHTLVLASLTGSVTNVNLKAEYLGPGTLAALEHDGIVFVNRAICVFRGLALRFTWIMACMPCLRK